MNRKLLTSTGIGALSLLCAGALALQAAPDRPIVTAPGTVISNATLSTGSRIPSFPTVTVGQTCTRSAGMTHTPRGLGGVALVSSGSKTAVVGQPVTQAGRAGFTTTVAGFNSRSASAADKAGVGSIDIRFDTRNPGVTSTVIANQTTAPFPATQHSYFHATFTIDGKTYRTVKPVHLTATLTAFPPAVGTEYVLAEDLELVNVENSEDVIVLASGKAAVITG